MRNLGVAVALLISSVAAGAQVETSLLQYVPETIAPEWRKFFADKGQYRDQPLAALDDLQGWKAAQAANDATKEAHAVHFSEMFTVTYEGTKIAGISVIRVLPETLTSQDKIGLYTHGGGYVMNSAKALLPGPTTDRSLVLVVGGRMV